MNPFCCRQLKLHCSYGLRSSQYNANELQHPSSSTQNWKFYDVRIHICVCVCPSTSCTLVIQSWRRLYNENWNIYSVLLVNDVPLAISLLLLPTFGVLSQTGKKLQSV